MNELPTIQITPTQGGGKYREVCEYAEFLTTTYPTPVAVSQAVADKLMSDERFMAWRRARKAQERKAKP